MNKLEGVRSSGVVPKAISVKELPKKGKPGEVVFTFELKPEVVQGRIDGWNKRKNVESL